MKCWDTQANNFLFLITPWPPLHSHLTVKSKQPIKIPDNSGGTTDLQKRSAIWIWRFPYDGAPTVVKLWCPRDLRADWTKETNSPAKSHRFSINWCCFCYSIRNSLVALLKALFALTRGGIWANPRRRFSNSDLVTQREVTLRWRVTVSTLCVLNCLINKPRESSRSRLLGFLKS